MHSSGSTFRMFRLAGWTGLVALALVLASCGQPQNVKSDVAPAQGTLQISVEGVAQAGVQVFNSGDTTKAVYAETISGSATVSLPAGTYVIDGAPEASTIDPSPAAVVVKSGQTTKVLLQYQTVSAPQEPVASLTIDQAVDITGAALPGQWEDNKTKDVMIYAAQSEEPVCVTVTAKDAQGSPVANAPITVTVAEALHMPADSITILRGCTQGAVEATGLLPAAVKDGIFTGTDGTATFTLYATSGITWSPESFGQDNNDLASLQSFNTTDSGYGLVKITVGVENADNTNVIAEFKAVFYNLAHLFASFDKGDKQYTGQRVGKDFGWINNIWNEDRPYKNNFDIKTILFAKQPTDYIHPWAVGFIRYEIYKELNKDGQEADVAHFENCSDVVKQGLNDICEDFDGHVDVVPNDGLTLEDMPITAKVRATLVVTFTYGKHTYDFDLKDYQVIKQWIGSYMRITKSVDHHVLTWAGTNEVRNPRWFPSGYPGFPTDEHTLDAANAPTVTPNSVFTATVTIQAKNMGTENVYDVSIADMLPPELGILESTIQPAGGTYDADKHEITWNFGQNAPIPDFGTVGPGQTLTVSFQVYVRQKPGYCVDQADYDLSQGGPQSSGYALGWNFAALGDNAYTCLGTNREPLPGYADPYAIINGEQQQDVTASWFSAPAGTPKRAQSLTDFNGATHRDDVIIWAVRPEFAITKKVADHPPGYQYEVGEDALFDITVKNVVPTGASTPSWVHIRQTWPGGTPDYSQLMATYPTEFSDASSDRDNPYGANITVADVFTSNLDFNNATGLQQYDSTDAAIGSPYAVNFPIDVPWLTVVDKGFLWATMPLLGGDNYAKTRVTLEHDAAGPNTNAAVMVADNLNQLDYGHCPAPDGEQQWPTPPIKEGAADLPNLLADCAFTTSVPITSPFLTLNASGNTAGTPGYPNVNPENVKKGDHFFFVFQISNTGNEDAMGTAVDVTLDNSSLWQALSNATIMDGATTIRSASITSSGVTFPTFTLPQGKTYYVVLELEALFAGNVNAGAQVNYTSDTTDPQHDQLPLNVTEQVSIAVN